MLSASLRSHVRSRRSVSSPVRRLHLIQTIKGTGIAGLKTTFGLGAKKTSGTIRSGRITRLLDFHLGRLLLVALGIGHQSVTPKLKTPQRIGICAFGAIGDALLSSAIIADLKRLYPNSRVVMVVSQSNSGIVPLLPQCDECIILPLYSPFQATAMMRRNHFDLLIDANQWLRISAIYCALAGAGHTVGFRTPGQSRHYAFDSVAEHRSDRHEIENYRGLLSAIGIRGTSLPNMLAPTDDQEPLRDLIRSPYVVFHPWAGGGQAALKEWPASNWIRLAEVLSARGYTIVMTGAPGDKEKSNRLFDAANQQQIPLLVVAGLLNLRQTGALLTSADLVISVNTGVMHMAAAVGVPLVALHGPTDPVRWGPLSPNAINVVPSLVPADVPVGYLNLGFEFPPGVPDCMGFISVEMVLDAIDEVMKMPDRRSSLAQVQTASA
jgi:heptosyltransferase III